MCGACADVRDDEDFVRACPGCGREPWEDAGERRPEAMARWEVFGRVITRDRSPSGCKQGVTWAERLKGVYSRLFVLCFTVLTSKVIHIVDLSFTSLQHLKSYQDG